jgi:cytochrome c
MSDIFISYAREDRTRVEPLAQALAAQGWSVWWDREIPFGKEFGQVIKEALTTARCIIVVWSNRSVNSHWVLDEASYGRDQKILIPVFIDRTSPPLGFGQIQAAYLIKWNGKTTSLELQKLVDHIHKMFDTKGGLPKKPDSDEESVINVKSSLAKLSHMLEINKRYRGVVFMFLFIIVIAAISIFTWQVSYMYNIWQSNSTLATSPGDDTVAGKKAFNQCRACHMADQPINRVGPHLVGLIGRKAGAIEGFSYSDAMKNSGITWNEGTLSKYLKDPKGFIPGNKMAYAGMKKDDDLKNLIAYLKETTK